MKCIFTLAGENPWYQEMTKALVASARVNANLELYCLYDSIDKDFMSWLESWNVTVLPWRVTFLKQIKTHYKGDISIEFCAGTYLCTEIPVALRYYGIKDRYVLYVDTDTLILNEIDLSHQQPRYYSAPPDWGSGDWTFASAGVMFLNTETLLESYSKFVDYMRFHDFNFDFAGHGGADQAAWNTFYRGLWEKLEPIFDWKPWWGFNPDAPIIHFSGPKPQEIQTLLDNPIEKTEDSMRRKINLFVVKQDREAFQRYLRIWNRYLILATSGW